MKRLFVMASLLCQVLIACGDKKNQENTHITHPNAIALLEEWDLQKEGIGKKIGRMLNSPKPRVVARGAKPEIAIKGEQIFVDGKAVRMGQPIETWKALIPSRHRCEVKYKIVVCDWDDLGITLMADEGKVTQFTVHFNLAPWSEVAHKSADGSMVIASVDHRPRNPFRGYFEWDGFGVDANTKFWEIRSGINSERKLNCDFLTNNCGTTRVRFGHDAVITVALYQTIHEDGIVEDFTVSWSAPSSSKKYPVLER